MSALPRIAITHGDINGVGYEVILKTFEDERLAELCVPVLFGSSKVLAFYRKQLELETKYNVIESPAEAKSGILNVINCVAEDVKVEPGVSSAEGGKAALSSLEAAVRTVADGEMDILVTAPINKKKYSERDIRVSRPY